MSTFAPARSRLMHRPCDYLTLWLRMLFGAHLLYSSLRYFLMFDAQPVVPGLGGEFIHVLTAMGIFPLVKALEGVVGACLVGNLFVPLMLVAEVPISLNIFYLNALVVGTPRQMYTGPQEIVLNLLLVAAYWKYYRAALVPRTQPSWPLHRGAALARSTHAP